MLLSLSLAAVLASAPVSSSAGVALDEPSNTTVFLDGGAAREVQRLLQPKDGRLPDVLQQPSVVHVEHAAAGPGACSGLLLGRAKGDAGDLLQRQRVRA